MEGTINTNNEQSCPVMVSIVIVNYNGLSDTCELLECFEDPNEYHIVVVDNASIRNEGKAIKEKYPWVCVIRSESNLGYAGACNLGIRNTKSKYIFIINNDILLDPRELRYLTNRLDGDPAIGIVCPKLRYNSGEKPIQFAGYTQLSSITLRNSAIGQGQKDDGSFDIPHPTPYAHGAAMMVRRDTIEKVGEMPECYFLYYEEYDWSEMMKRMGYKIWYEPACTIYHKESQSTGKVSPLHTYYLTRNRLLFAKRNTPKNHAMMTYAYVIFLVCVRDVIKYYLKGQSDIAKATIHGVNDFLRGRSHKQKYL